MEIDFDPVKRGATLAERGLDFTEAAVLFADLSYTIEDARFAYPEPRFLTFGLLRGRLTMAAWTPTATRATGGIRVI